MDLEESQTWAEIIEPIVRRCEVSASLDLKVVFDKEGAIALAEILKTMADCLDNKSLPTFLN